MIEHRNYANLTTYIFKAEAALEATMASNGVAVNAVSTQTATQNAAAAAKKREKEQIQTKLDLASAFSHLGQGNYEKVASYMFRLGPPKDLGDWAGKVSPPLHHLANDDTDSDSTTVVAYHACGYRYLRHIVRTRWYVPRFAQDPVGGQQALWRLPRTRTLRS